jgi:hypothetical protein
LLAGTRGRKFMAVAMAPNIGGDNSDKRDFQKTKNKIN